MRVLWTLFLGLGCSSAELKDPTGCDPLDKALCALPFPSSYFLEENPASKTGFQVAFGEEALPINIDDVRIKPRFWNEKDGFSTLTPILAFFPDVDESLLMTHAELDKYTSETVSTVLLNATTGERVPHFAELDYAYLDEIIVEEPANTLLHIYPVVPLDFSTRYIVAYRGLTDTQGNAFEPSVAFRALRDGEETNQSDVENRRSHFDEQVFPLLETNGVERSSLQLAFDFVTVSRDKSLGRMEWMRDDARSRMAESGPPYTVTQVEPETLEESLQACASGAAIGRTIYGDMTVPLYTTEDDQAVFLTRDENGQPFYNGDTQADFMVRVPCSLMETPRPGPILQYGHGLLGSKGEARTGYLSDFADENGYVIVATDWKGMSDKDRGHITLMVAQDISNFAIIPERSMQGYVEFVALMQLAMKGLSKDELLSFEGVNVIDPERRYYYGNSQGGIMGGAYMAMSKEIQRGVLGVAGAPYAILLPRSSDFEPFFDIMTTKFNNPHEIELAMALFQQVWDPGEAGGWFQDMNQDPPEGMEAKDVLLQVAIGDAQVTTLGAHVMARAYGASTIAPETRPIWGVPEAESGHRGSAIVEWEYPDGATEPFENIPPESALDTHECPRREPLAQQQMQTFFERGVVEQTCDGPCVSAREGLCD